jgi:hypothetical protein
VLFTGEEFELIREYAEKLEPIELGGTRQLGLFGNSRAEKDA